MHSPADRHAPLFEALGWRKLDRGIRRPGRSRATGPFFKPIPPITRPSRGKSIRPSFLPPAAKTIGFIPDMPAKWRQNFRRLGYDAHFYEQAAGGHGAERDNTERAAFVALGLAFLRDKIGWNDDDSRQSA